MTVKKLLEPRYEVIADYPQSPYKVGECLDANTEYMLALFRKYPNLFREMKWYEKRTAKEMPRRLMYRFDDKEYFCDIHGWDMDNLIGVVSDTEICSLPLGYLPAD